MYYVIDNAMTQMQEQKIKNIAVYNRTIIFNTAIITLLRIKCISKVGLIRF